MIHTPDSHRPITELFFGRDKEFDLLKDHFTRGSRLAQVNGVRGVGKSAFVRVFEESNRELFPGGTQYTNAFAPEGLGPIIQSHLERRIRSRNLLIIDDAEVLPTSDIAKISRVIDENPPLNLILVSTEQLPLRTDNPLSVRLDGLEKTQFMALLGSLLYGRLDRDDYANIHMWSQFYKLTGGNPMIGIAAAQLVREGGLNWHQIFKALSAFQYNAILGPEGWGSARELVIPPKIIVAVTNVNEELLARIRANPEMMRKLPPPKFEEIVAELFEKQGYVVDLTPASKDGGFDMYVAKQESIGQFLYLVECKRYAPPTKVGVEIVRALHGVVQQRQANAGIIVTTSFFTKGAIEFHRQIRYQMHLHDYITLQKWLGII